MTSYFSISDDTFGRGMPWIQTISDGMVDEDSCPTCGRGQSRLGNLKVLMQDEPAKYWPDMLGCGHFPIFVVSQRFVDAMREDGIRLELGGTVEILEPVENGLRLEDAPLYYWVDGKRHRAARMDFQASGYVDAQLCRNCSALTYNIPATSAREDADPPPPVVFDYDAGSGHDLFTPDMSWARFFCTDRLLRCASRSKLTNIRFVRVEDGVYGEPVKY